MATSASKDERGIDEEPKSVHVIHWSLVTPVTRKVYILTGAVLESLT